MDKIKLQQQVEELKAKLAEVEHELAKSELVSTYWQPEHNEEYFYIDSGASIHKTCCAKNKGTEIRYRAFKTREEAQTYAEYVKAEEVLKAEIARLNEGWLPDWKHGNQQKFYIRLYQKNLQIDYYCQFKVLPNFMYLKSNGLAHQLIKTHSKELMTYLSY